MNDSDSGPPKAIDPAPPMASDSVPPVVPDARTRVALDGALPLVALDGALPPSGRETRIGVAILLLLFAMASIQAGAALAKDLFPKVGALGMTAYRLGFASLFLVAAHRPWGPRRIRLAPGAGRDIVLYGIALGIMNLSFYLALARIPLGLAVALEFTGPLAVALLDSRRKADLSIAACAAIGLSLLAPEAFRSELDPVGVGLALLAGTAWAFYIVYGKKAGAGSSGAAVTTIGMAVAALVAVPIGVGFETRELFQPAVIPFAFGVALFSSVIPYSLELVALRRLPTRTFGVLMSLEPALAALAGYAFLGERMRPHHLVAIALIMVASFGSTVVASRDARR